MAIWSKKFWVRQGRSPEVEVKRQSSFSQDYDRVMEAITFAEAGAPEVAQEIMRRGAGEHRKILVVGREDAFPEHVMDYAINLAQRLGYDLVALNLTARFTSDGAFSPYRNHLREEFAQRAAQAAQIFRQMAASKGVRLDAAVKFGSLSQALDELHREIKRLEMVVTPQEEESEESAPEMALPVFSISSTQGERTMAKDSRIPKKKPLGKTIVFGVLTVALYAAVFWKSDTVMHYFTKGGWYAALPIASVFLFSLVHGSFSSYLWTLLGIEATKKTALRVEEKRPAPTKRPRLRARVNL
jgi:hypothetical protein